MSEQPAEQKLLKDEVTGEMVSKAELKRRQKQRAKDAEKAKKAAEQPQAAKKQGDDAVSGAEFTAQRKQQIAEWKKEGKSPYVYKVHITCSIQEFKDKYSADEKIAEKGAIDTSVIESISGRIMSIRKSGQTLTFLNIEEQTVGLQVFCSADQCKENLGKKFEVAAPKPNMNTLTEENVKNSSNYDALCGKTYDWYNVIADLKRGDIICVTGFPMRSKTGELSIAPVQVLLTAPCLHQLPKANQKVTDIEYRYTNRSVDLFFNKKS